MNAMAATSTTTTQEDERTPGQVRQAQDIAANAVAKMIEKLDPSKTALQQLIGNAAQLTDVINDKVAELLKVETFEDEEAGFNAQYDYPRKFAVKDLGEQMAALREHFPQLGMPNMELYNGIQSGKIALPVGAEGWFAIPNPTKLGSSYGQVLQRMIDAIAKNRPLENYRKGALGPDRLRRTARTTEMLARLAETQGNADILIVAAQFGKRHAGRSARRARFVFETNEFGLGGYEIASMLLTHPERLVHYDNLWIDCPGDEYDYVADGSWTLAPIWFFYGERLGFVAYWFVIACSFYGSASGFLPQ